MRVERVIDARRCHCGQKAELVAYPEVREPWHDWPELALCTGCFGPILSAILDPLERRSLPEVAL